jgi:hypothetical protein
MRAKSSVLCALTALLSVRSAWAAEEAEVRATGPRFGQAREVVLGGDFWVYLNHYEYVSDAKPTTYVIVRPAVDYFVADHLSLGGGLGFARSWQEGESSNSFEVRPRIGYELPVGDAFSVWPRAGIQYELSWFNDSYGSSSNRTLEAFAQVPVLAHVTPHFFVGIGPTFNAVLSYSRADWPKATSVGVESTIGGWL